MLPTGNQIHAQVDAVLRHDAAARCVAIRADREGPWPRSFTVRGREFGLRWCASNLAVRSALDELDDSHDAGCVLLTRLADTELGADVLARFARGRVFEVDSWEIVAQIFQARDIDARLARQGWIANALIELTPPGGHTPVPSGFLDLDTAWKAVLERGIGLPGPRPDLIELLRWTTRPEDTARLARLPQASRSAVLAWIAESAGTAGALAVDALGVGDAGDAIPLGLVCGVVFASTPDPVADLAAAAVRLERFVGGRRIMPEVGRRWAEAAASALRSVGQEAMRGCLERADELLQALHVSEHAGLSDLLPAGLEARLQSYAGALQAFAERADEATSIEVERTSRAALAHGLAPLQAARMERVRMGARLVRAARRADATPAAGLKAAATAYAQQGAYIDLARMKLMGGDELAELSRAYGALGDTARERRDADGERFARAFEAWNREGGEIDGFVPVEHVLDRVLGPVATRMPVLLLVVDGLSLPIFEELAGDIAGHGWLEVVPEGRVRALVGVAALPTVTEVSRASLLSGRLTIGASNAEKSSFASHPALLGASRAGAKPILFHKGELGDASGLADGVREAIADRGNRVVGVVFNAVDDNLSGSDQLHPRWTLDDLRLLKPLLHEARLAGRAMVVTADHGHVLEERSVQRTASEGDRWRLVAADVAPGEVLLSGGRVRAPGGGERVVCAWSERLRYSSKKNGYHGGVAPQEVLVPLSVFLPSRLALEGWVAAPPRPPDWWDAAPAPAASASSHVPVRAVPARSKKKAPGEQEDLFAAAAGGPPSGDWIAALLATEAYAQQRRLAARVAPRDDDMRVLLAALHERGGKLTKTALAQRLGMPVVRISGFVNAARRVLNVDQAPVVELDEAAGEVRLNVELLAMQFQVAVR